MTTETDQTKTEACQGIEIEPGVFSGCNADKTGATDCPSCGWEMSVKADWDQILNVVRGGLSGVVHEIELTESWRDKAKKEYEAEQEMRALRIKRLREQVEFLSTGVNPQILALGQQVVRIRGKAEESAEGAMDAAIKAVASGGLELVDRYIGAKRYSGFHQRTDCEYGYGPRHGSIVFAVELQDDYRKLLRDHPGMTLDEELRDAAVVYLMAEKKAGEIRVAEARRTGIRR